MIDGIKLEYASEEQERIGWVLDMRWLANLQQSLVDIGYEDISLEEIEAVLLIANGQRHLIPTENDNDSIDESHIEDITKFVEKASTEIYKPQCAITSMMIFDDIQRMSDDELADEALKLSLALSKLNS